MVEEIIKVAGKFCDSMFPFEEGSSTTRVTKPIGPAKSIYALMKETGSVDSKLKIDEKDLYDELIACPECIEQWLEASGCQRDEDTWSFLATSNGRYVVSRLANEAKNRLFQQTIFTDGNKACANFLMHLIEHYRERATVVAYFLMFLAIA